MQAAIAALVEERRDLSEGEAAACMDEIMGEGATPAQFGAFVVALRLKGESVDEIVGMARVMRARALHVEVAARPLLDTCGTGGDASGTFNVSTAAAFVAAAAGAKVAKHGNRAMTSQSGSADLLEALGAEIALGPEDVARCIERTGVGFMFAQAFHPAMKFAAPLRRELGVRTVFNILGPLTNPAGANCQLLGVPNEALAAKLAAALARLGTRHSLVVTAADGIDEVSVCGPTTLFEVRGEEVTRRTITPRELGLATYAVGELAGGTPAENAATLRAVLAGDGRAALHDFIVANAGAALYVCGLAATLAQGVDAARLAIASGDAAARIGAFVEATRRRG
ncbi:MAG: anthranilate phosphoribosyltransferase [Dehalococcoidia bacterium]|nr:anthranilate phosphoribosyltransferase [Dehalococcoidia bacterium]